VIGVISDTHGLLRGEALEVLRGCERILHAGDVGSPEVLEPLGQVAPVTAVRGNVDRGEWASQLPAWQIVEIGGLSLYMLHDLAELDLDPAAAGVSAVISGHTHVPAIEERRGVLFLNPGSAGPRRFSLPVTLARLHLEDGRLRAELVHLRVPRSGPGA